MTQQQQQYLAQGAKERRKLFFIGEQIATMNYVGKYPHHYIYSAPGLGKTHTVNESMRRSGVNYYTVTGNVSMYAFGLQLAVIHYLADKEQHSIISVDDCNELFKNATNINIMKNVLGENRVFHYQKNLGGLYEQLDDTMKSAIDQCVEEGVAGFKVPTNKMIFVFTSNEKLPSEETVTKARDRHLLAITDRVTNHELEMDSFVQWGWIADVVLNTNSCLFVSDTVRNQCVEFLYKNWSLVKVKSIRTAIKMCEDAMKFPNNYQQFWSVQYI